MLSTISQHLNQDSNSNTELQSKLTSDQLVLTIFLRVSKKHRMYKLFQDTLLLNFLILQCSKKNVLGHCTCLLLTPQAEPLK